MNSPRILTLDVETAPNVAAVFSLWNQNISLAQLRETSRIICWAAKWHDGTKIHAATDFHDGHGQSINRLYDLICEADVIVSYNGKNFDLRHIRREFLLAGLAPPPPWKDVDLLLEVRAQFRFASNKLEHVVQQLGLEEKGQTGGMALWNSCVFENSPAAWKKLRAYCKQDVLITEQLYDRIRPWIKHPHVGLYADSLDCCPKCGSTKLQRRGYAFTSACKYRQWACTSCGAWTRSRTSESTTKTRISQ